MITSSPGPMPSAISASSSASVPDDTATAWRDAEHAPPARASSAVDLGAHDEPLAVADAGDGGEDLVAQRPVLRLQVEQRDSGLMRGIDWAS